MGFSPRDALVISILTSITSIVVTLVAIATVDRVGRRPLLLLGSVGMALTLATVAVVFLSAPVVGGVPQVRGATAVFALVAANLFVVFFGATWGPVTWVVLGEVFPLGIRTAALSVAAAVQWLANFAVAFSFPLLSARDVGLPPALQRFPSLALTRSFGSTPGTSSTGPSKRASV